VLCGCGAAAAAAAAIADRCIVYVNKTCSIDRRSLFEISAYSKLKIANLNAQHI